MSVPLDLVIAAGALLGAVGLLLEIALDGAEFVREGREL